MFHSEIKSQYKPSLPNTLQAVERSRRSCSRGIDVIRVATRPCRGNGSLVKPSLDIYHLTYNLKRYPHLLLLPFRFHLPKKKNSQTITPDFHLNCVFLVHKSLAWWWWFWPATPKPGYIHPGSNSYSDWVVILKFCFSWIISDFGCCFSVVSKRFGLIYTKRIKATYSSLR